MHRFIIAFVLLYSAAAANCQWRKLHFGSAPSGGTGDLRAVYFQKTSNGDLQGYVGSSGTEVVVYSTKDGGKSWLMSDTIGECWDFAFKNMDTGWAAAYNLSRGVLKTTDAGNSWQIVWNPVLLSGAIAYSNYSGGLFTSTWGLDDQFISWDEGTSWQRIQLGYGTGYSFIGNSGVLAKQYSGGTPWYRTFDGGHNWQQTQMWDECWQPLMLTEAGKGFAISDYTAKIYKTTDWWNTWTNVYQFSPTQAVPDAYGSASSGCIRGDSCRLFVQLKTGVYMSTDDGLSWQSLAGPIDSFFIYDRRFSYCDNKLFVWAYDKVDDYLNPYIWTLDLDSLNFAGSPVQIQTQSNIAPGDTLAVNVVLDQSLTGTAAKDTVSFLFRYHGCDLLSFDTADWILADSSSSGNQMRLVFLKRDSVNGPNLLHLKFKTYLGESTSCSFAIDSVRFNTATTSTCAPLFTMARGDSITINFTGCGDSTLVEFMRAGSLVHIDRIVPNPAWDVVRVEGRGLTADGLEVYDVMGRRVSLPVSSLVNPNTTPQPPPLSEEGELDLDVRALPEGVYYLRAGQATARFEILR